jgi:ABC-2 type transport system ATP-binding protein
MLDAPVAIEVRDLKKAFRIPTQRVDSFKERIVKPTAREYRELKALDGISFDIHEGEFFGIVGRNGSGKSTLLKILASIYRADAGTIRMAGRLAPFIELGVGFNMDLTARENVVLNGVMMGLSPKETRDRLEGVIDFAELGDFADLKLKNYSSGMLVRLAFSTMMEADADIMLIDEVLAVGDAAFQQKCADAFHDMKARGKTIVLVTHAMASVEEYCHRAMLINDGLIQHVGDPSEIGREYLKLNFEVAAEHDEGHATADGEGVTLADAMLVDEDGQAVQAVEQGTDLVLRVDLDVIDDCKGLEVGFILANADGLGLFQWGTEVEGDGEENHLHRGERVTVNSRLRNLLAPGRYFVHCGVARNNNQSDVALYAHNAIDLVVFGTDVTNGLISIPHEVEATVSAKVA